jgi:hypothetical protein
MLFRTANLDGSCELELVLKCYLFVPIKTWSPVIKSRRDEILVAAGFSPRVKKYGMPRADYKPECEKQIVSVVLLPKFCV